MLEYAELGNIVIGILLVVGLAGLCLGGDWLAQGAGSLALKFRINPVIVGLTIVSMATSMPELIASFVSVSGGAPGLALGNILGSNIANIGLILGISALMMPIRIQWRLIQQEVPILLVMTVIFTLMAAPFSGSIIGHVEGWTLFLLMIAYLVFIICQSRKPGAVVESALEEIGKPVENVLVIAGLLAGGTVALALGAEMVFGTSVEIARRLEVSETIIGLTVVAVGTSLPELAASIAATARKQADIVAGNIVGSNIFNLVFIGGAVSGVFTLPIDPGTFSIQFPAMLFLTALLWWMFFSDRLVTRREGAGLLILYAAIIGVSTFLG